MELHCQKLVYQMEEMSLLAPKLVPDTKLEWDLKKKAFLELILGILR